MGIVFINYRRDETAGEARALHNDLAELIGADRVFMDVDDIALGSDFRQVLKARLDDCAVMLSLIGREWVHARDAAGARRLDNPADFVRIEIATALQRNVAVTPVLLQDASMPSAESLPDDLKDLAYRNGFELSHTRWESDVHELVRRLGLLPAAKPKADAAPADAAGPAVSPPAAPARSRTPVLIAVLAVVVSVAAVLGWKALAPQPSHADIAKLVTQINDDSDAERRRAADRLRREFSRSKVAVGLAVNQLSAANFQQLSKEGRIELLGFLLASDDSAWTTDRRVEAADAVRRIHQRIAAGNASLVPQVKDLVDQLGRRVGE